MLSLTHDGVADLRERPFDAPESNRIRRAPEGCRQLARVPADLDIHLASFVWAALGDTYPADPATQHQHPCGGCAGCAGVFDSEKTVVNGSLPQNALLYRKESQAAISGQRRHLRACVRDAAAFVAVQGQRLSKVPSLTAHARLARCRKRGVRVIRLLRGLSSSGTKLTCLAILTQVNT